MNKKFFRKLHLWLSVPFGVIITLICFSGAMLVFENEVTESVRHDFYYVESNGEKALPLDSLARIVKATLPDSVEITGVVVNSNPDKAYRFNLSKPRRAFVAVDQYTGEVKGRNERLPFFNVMFRLHRWLLDSPGGEGIAWGKMIVGVSTLMFVVVLITGIVIWFPRSRKALKSGLKIRFRNGWQPLWYSLHVAGGMYALVFILAMALTGLTWSFGWYRTGFYKVFGVEMQQPKSNDGKKTASDDKKTKGKNPGSKSDGKHADADTGASPKAEKYIAFATWQSVCDELAMRNPEFATMTVSDGSASVSNGGFGNSRASDKYKFDTATGKITDVSLYKDADKQGKIRGWIYSVHVGSWGGLLTRILAFLAALLGASLPITGYYLWLKRICRK